MKEIAGKTAFITGGASGIGLGIGKALARHGARVMLSDIDPAILEQAAGDFPGRLCAGRGERAGRDAVSG